MLSLKAKLRQLSIEDFSPEKKSQLVLGNQSKLSQVQKNLFAHFNEAEESGLFTASSMDKNSALLQNDVTILSGHDKETIFVDLRTEADMIDTPASYGDHSKEEYRLPETRSGHRSNYGQERLSIHQSPRAPKQIQQFEIVSDSWFTSRSMLKQCSSDILSRGLRFLRVDIGRSSRSLCDAFKLIAFYHLPIADITCSDKFVFCLSLESLDVSQRRQCFSRFTELGRANLISSIANKEFLDIKSYSFGLPIIIEGTISALANLLQECDYDFDIEFLFIEGNILTLAIGNTIIQTPGFLAKSSENDGVTITQTPIESYRRLKHIAPRYNVSMRHSRVFLVIRSTNVSHLRDAIYQIESNYGMIWSLFTIRYTDLPDKYRSVDCGAFCFGLYVHSFNPSFSIPDLSNVLVVSENDAPITDIICKNILENSFEPISIQLKPTTASQSWHSFHIPISMTTRRNTGVILLKTGDQSCFIVQRLFSNVLNLLLTFSLRIVLVTSVWNDAKSDHEFLSEEEGTMTIMIVEPLSPRSNMTKVAELIQQLFNEDSLFKRIARISSGDNYAETVKTLRRLFTIRKN